MYYLLAAALVFVVSRIWCYAVGVRFDASPLREGRANQRGSQNMTTVAE